MLIADEPDKLLMIPGPTPVEREILNAMAVPTMSHTSAAVAEIVSECLEGIKTVAETRHGQPFAFGGAGTLAQEVAVINVVAPGERLLVASNGFFGDRFLPIARAHGVEVDHLAAEWGASVTPGQLEERLAQTSYRAVAVTHVETSTGVRAPVEDLCGVARRQGVLAIVDAVCSFAGTPVRMDDWGIDLLLTGAQKALGVPPGLAILVASPAALERRRQMPSVASFYGDLLNWLPSMQNPTTYFSTHSVNLFYALRSALRLIAREELAPRYARHERLGRAFRAGMAALGFRSLARPEVEAPTMSVLRYPDGIEDAQFRATLARNGVVAAGCLGQFSRIGLRFGHMGNIDQTEILQGLAAVEESLIEHGAGFDAGAGVGAAQAQLSASARSLATSGAATVR